MKVIILALVFTLNGLAYAADRFQGEYSQKTRVISGDNGQEPTDATNSVTISKMENEKNTYLVKISTVGGHVHMCEFEEEMKVKGKKLVFGKDQCKVEITPSKKGIDLSAEECDAYCGMGVSLDGTGEGFEKVGPGSSTEGNGKF